MTTRKTVILISAFLLSTGVLAAQPMQRGHGNGAGPGCSGGRMYDLTTVQTVGGTVTSVDRFSATRGMGARIDVMLQTSDKTLRVLLGPDWYIDKLPSAIVKGDVIDVKGSLMTIAGQETLIAAEIQRNGETIVLRDANGIPLWAGLR